MSDPRLTIAFSFIEEIMQNLSAKDKVRLLIGLLNAGDPGSSSLIMVPSSRSQSLYYSKFWVSQGYDKLFANHPNEVNEKFAKTLEKLLVDAQSRRESESKTSENPDREKEARKSAYDRLVIYI
ncbi:hypothetical protein [uncultured Ruegeria sp.]|uniref:hypothetical protein n=1 Tax=uncultured Ruegeria sp. TaxID=259304 RepID=UPI002623DC8E|nr:hypothetical protein [uncultured Ruegeria sp.]